MKNLLNTKIKSCHLAGIFLVAFMLLSVFALSDVSAQSGKKNKYEGTHQCGNLQGDKANQNYKTKFDFGCLGPEGPRKVGAIPFGPIVDLAFSLLRFISAGVGIAIIISIIAAGIQYASSEGSAEASGKDKLRIRNAIAGLLVYVFAYSAMQFLVPGGIFTSILPALSESIGAKLWF